MKVSFDFDSTLDCKHIQDYAYSLIKKGHDVWIVTSRLCNADCPSPDWNKDLYKVANRLQIPREKIIFVGNRHRDKYEYFIDKDFTWHLDDDWIEINLINEKCSTTKGISQIGNKNWKAECNKLLKLQIKDR